MKKLREMREINGLELDQQEVEPAIGRKFKTKFDIPIEYSENILIMDNDFILPDRTNAICITADMSFNTRMEAEFKREYRGVFVQAYTRIERPGGTSSFSLKSSRQILMLFSDKSQREKHEESRARDAGLDTIERLPGRMRNKKGFDASLRSQQGQIEP